MPVDETTPCGCGCDAVYREADFRPLFTPLPDQSDDGFTTLDETGLFTLEGVVEAWSDVVASLLTECLPRLIAVLLLSLMASTGYPGWAAFVATCVILAEYHVYAQRGDN